MTGRPVGAVAAALVVVAAVALIWPAGPGRRGGPRAGRSGRLGGPRPGGGAKSGLRERAGLHRMAVPTAGIAVVALAALAVAGPVAGLLAAVCVAAGAGGVRAKRTSSAESACRDAELEVLAGLSAELRGGRHPAAALLAVQTPQDPELAAALEAARATAALGGDVGAALRRYAGSRALAKLAAGWQLSEGAGAPLADLVAQIANDVRGAGLVRRSAQVELSGARATGLILAILPLLGIALGAAMGAHPLRILLHTPAGAACAVAGLAFELAGLGWMRRLTAGALRTIR